MTNSTKNATAVAFTLLVLIGVGMAIMVAVDHIVQGNVSVRDDRDEDATLRRLVIGEAGRFPELGRTFYERGPQRTISALTTAFERLAERGLLQFDDPRLAAAHFNWLVMSIPLNQAMLLGTDEHAAPADLDRYANAGARAFLAAYGRS